MSIETAVCSGVSLIVLWGLVRGDCGEFRTQTTFR